MSEEEKQYFELRAEQEIAMACNASQRPVVQAHYDLACAYLDRIYIDGGEGRPERP